VTRIVNVLKERLSSLEGQEESLKGIEEVKLHSFYHYLSKIKFQGYGKWVVLNQCVKEEHP